MLQFAVTLLQWLPRIFVWLVVPTACLSIVLVPARKLRPHAALGLMIAAAISATFLALETAAFGYICCDQARMLFSVLLDFRPGVTIGFAVALLGSIATPLAGILPMLFAAVATGLGAFLLRRGSGLQINNITTVEHGEAVS
ncbi:MAG TPA: hypothetical protein VHT03_11610 [Rhizomicrobium sp.]|nr:hypothetical protein [Rhizomicrobium sp.]